MLFQIIAAASVISLLGADLAAGGETRADQAMPAIRASFTGGAMGDKCRVDVVRRAASGSANITRQVLDGGGCVCTVTTGPIGSHNPAEDIVSNLLGGRECDGAPNTQTQYQPAEASGGGGVTGGGLAMGGAALAGLGLAAAGGGGSDSRG